MVDRSQEVPASDTVPAEELPVREPGATLRAPRPTEPEMSDADRRAHELASYVRPARVFDGWDDIDGRPAAWKAFGEPSEPVFGIGAPLLPAHGVKGGVK